MPVLRADTTGLVQEATLRVVDEHVPVKEEPSSMTPHRCVDETVEAVMKTGAEGGQFAISNIAPSLSVEVHMGGKPNRPHVKEEPIVAVDATLTVEAKICEAVPACMESMGLLIEVLQKVLSPAVCGAVVDRYIISGSDPPGLRWLVDPGCDPPMLSCC